jgi:hypothetical protein
LTAKYSNGQATVETVQLEAAFADFGAIIWQTILGATARFQQVCVNDGWSIELIALFVSNSISSIMFSQRRSIDMAHSDSLTGIKFKWSTYPNFNLTSSDNNLTWWTRTKRFYIGLICQPKKNMPTRGGGE